MMTSVEGGDGTGMRRAIAIAAATVAMMPAVGIAGDIAAGQAVFNRCKICHTVEAGGRNGVGPNLHGIFGRKAGAVDGFPYSEAMKNSGIVWDDTTLGKFLSDPRDSLLDNKMSFPGIKDDKQMADLLAYLHQTTQ